MNLHPENRPVICESAGETTARSASQADAGRRGPPKAKRVANFLLLRVTGMSRQVSQKMATQSMPLLATGKIDHQAVLAWLKEVGEA